MNQISVSTSWGIEPKLEKEDKIFVYLFSRNLRAQKAIIDTPDLNVGPNTFLAIWAPPAGPRLKICISVQHFGSDTDQSSVLPSPPAGFFKVNARRSVFA